jgi:hypothetical protein
MRIEEQGGVIMKKVYLLLLFLLVLLVPFVTLSCDSVTTPKAGLNIVATVIQQTAGSAIFRIGVENTGTKTETLNFVSSQFYDIEVKDSGGHLLWQYSYGSYFLDLVWDLELAPGESSQVREYVWNLTGNDQEPLHPGSYKARIYITSSPRDAGLSTVINLTI